jgi:hypothetical protein
VFPDNLLQLVLKNRNLLPVKVEFGQPLQVLPVLNFL